ncbi:MAG: nucleotide sugar dehydrogenase [Methanobrevibacter sp.]|nr:nucleotide sugar dehydrogenase [Methanobrevibacter sp.]
MNGFKNDIVIIGTGRVGLPLGLMLSKVGFKSSGVDKDMDIANSVNNKKMPFNEAHFDEIIKDVDFNVACDFENLAETKNIIITVGTPLLSHIETDLSQLNSVLEELTGKIVPSHNIILRSTVAPKTTEYVKKFLEKKTDYVIGKDIFLSFCPERIAEGKAYTELQELPQIIGAEDEESFRLANNIFSRLTKKTFKTNFLSAELVKLFNNISRYANFAISNHFAIVADDFGQNIYDILEMANSDYPRGNISTPGFTAGTCLRKDFGMISENIPYSDIFLSSWKVNESIPKFLVENLNKRCEISNKNVAVLGYTFKQDADDTRDSLVPKLIRYLEREVPSKIMVSEPFLEYIDDKYKNYPLINAVKKADIIYISTNHSEFIEKRDKILKNAKVDCYFVDLWNVLGKNKIFFRKSDVEI